MTFFLGAQGFMQPEGHGGLCAMGKQGSAPSGVYDYGTLEECPASTTLPVQRQLEFPLPTYSSSFVT